MRRVGLAIVILALCSACGGGSSGAGSVHSSPPVPQANASTASAASEQALKTAVYAYTNNLLSGNADAAFAALSSRCQSQVGLAAYSRVVAKTSKLYNGLTITSYTVNVFYPPNATVSYGTAVAQLKEVDQPWVLEDGTWHFDQC